MVVQLLLPLRNNLRVARQCERAAGLRDATEFEEHNWLLTSDGAVLALYRAIFILERASRAFLARRQATWSGCVRAWAATHRGR